MESHNDIVLTPEEINEALDKAKQQKAALINLRAWKNKINKPLEQYKFNFEETQALVLRKVQDLFPGNSFQLTKAEEEFYTILCHYFSNSPEFSKLGEDFNLNKGIIVFGGVGRGKTTAMKLFGGNTKQSYIIKPCDAIAREYTSEGPAIIDKYSEMQENRNKAFTFNHASLGICFDDLGTEEDKSHYGNKVNVMQEILLAIHQKQFVSGYKYHITTNMSSDQIEARYGLRVRSRIREMFNVLYYPDGADRRK